MTRISRMVTNTAALGQNLRAVLGAVLLSTISESARSPKLATHTLPHVVIPPFVPVPPNTPEKNRAKQASDENNNPLHNIASHPNAHDTLHALLGEYRLGSPLPPVPPRPCSAAVPGCEFTHRPGAFGPTGGGTPPALAGADACATSHPRAISCTTVRSFSELDARRTGHSSAREQITARAPPAWATVTPLGASSFSLFPPVPLPFKNLYSGPL
jgi:hypothetical protein